MEHGKTLKVSLNHPIKNEGPYTFDVPADPEYYTDLSSCRLQMKFKVVKHDGTHLTDNDVVAPINNLPHSLFNSVQFFSNNQLVTDQSTLQYSIKAYVENVLSYNTSNDSAGAYTMGHCLESDMFFMDTPNHYNDVGTPAIAAVGAAPAVDAKISENTGFKNRQFLIRGSRVVDVMVPLHVDVINTPTFLPLESDFQIKFTRNSDKYLFMVRDVALAPKIELLSMVLYVNKIKVKPEKVLEHNSLLAGGQLGAFPLSRTVIKELSLTRGATNFEWSNIFGTALVPNQIILLLADSAALNGDYQRNPLRFYHYQLRSLTPTVNGHVIANAGEGYSEMQWGAIEQNLAVPFRSNVDQLGYKQYNVETFLTKQQFKHGCTLFVFDTSPDLCGNTCLHPPKRGAVNIKGVFADALPENVTVIALGAYRDYMILDKFKTLTLHGLNFYV